ncbi:MAG TPA: class I SAM-dependent methyltransferase [Terriglobia bacterium]|nr:class I SAM-dependent methyltransferase [Terriglobia bacterium]
MIGSTNLYSDSPLPGRPENSVDEFFHEHSQYWKDVYQADTLSAVIYRERRSAVLSMVHNLLLPVRSRILEVGCGAGSTSVALARRGYRVNAVDTVEGMLELTRQAANEAVVGADLEVSSADICQLSFPSGYFALALAVGVFAWLEQPRRALAELHRVTRSGGYVIITATNSWCLNQVLDPLCFPGLRPMRWQIAEVLEKFNVWRRSRPRQHRYSVKQVDALLSQTGFQKLTGRTLGFGPFTVFKQKLLPNRGDVKLHQKFQALADRRFPLVRSSGVVYVALAQKP